MAGMGIYPRVVQGVTPLPGSLSSKTYILCNANDVVCDFHTPFYLGPLTVPAAHYKHGKDVHTFMMKTSYAKLETLGNYSASSAPRAVAG
jgi:hypothetical protein